MGTKGPKVEDIRRAAEGMLSSGNSAEALEYLMSALASVLRHNVELEQKLAKLERARFGRSSERIDPRQLLLLFEELSRQSSPQDKPDVEAENRADDDLNREIEDARKDETEQKNKNPRKKASRVKARNVTQVHHQQTVAEADRKCTGCDKPKVKIGEEVTRTLEFVPAQFIEHVYHREKLACGTCKDAVTTAEAPKRILPRSDAGPGLLAHIVVSKFTDHSPLHRLHRIYRRADALVPVSTMSDWVAGAAHLLSPIVDRLIERKARSHVIGTDATGLRVLDPDAAANIIRGTIWCYVLDYQDVVFRYARSGDGASGPLDFLKGRTGYLQADAASVFNPLYLGVIAWAVEVGCWSHGRRRFEAIKDDDCRAAYPLRLITRLFRIETLADLRKLDHDQRKQMREQRSAPVLAAIANWVNVTRETEPPASALAKAANYLHNQWVALTRFLEDGRLLLHNNLVEQQLRDVALGRKNFLFAGSHDAAERIAVLYSLMRTCALRKVPPLPYLTDVLRKLADGWPSDRLDDLTPDRWLQLYGTQFLPAND